ncbi:MAG: 16S rRNA (cytosine(967)-C(5))-methyltransferase RsmB [Candidatus Tritonobacter lacicola]|nr:16S rRNA (cytosine(967)-C(5))-methyltransferase RsmB [Candidatus Tritonobacter lacicola]
MGAREIAYSVLLRHRRGAGNASELLNRAFLEEKPAASDRALATELIYGCIRRRLTLEWLIREYSRFRLPADVKVLLSLGLYQLLYLDRIPDYAAVNESVRMARAAGKKKWASTVNAILRRVQDDRRNLSWPSREEGLKKHLEVRHSHPAWLVDILLKDFGPCSAEEILKENNRRPPITIRCNTLKVRPEELGVRLASEGIDAEPAGAGQIFFRIRSDIPVFEIAAFREGLFTVQDVSAGLAVEMLGPRPGESILDLCAGPGGKTTHIAQLTRDRGEIVAIDISVDKVRMIEDSCRRLGIRSVRCVRGDGREGGSLCGGRLFDRVLVDAPCSNTGVLRRRVEARWRMNPSRVKELSGLQLSLLKAASRCLKKGGYLVYSTCSILRDENDAVLGKFLAWCNAGLSHAVLKLQGRHSGDGIYCALMRRTGK